MDRAKYWNTDGFSYITPEQYERNSDLFEGHLYCPDQTCHAAVKYRHGSSNTHGAKHSRKAHFWTDRGQEHREGCDFTSEIDATDRVKLADALKKGEQVLINLNLQTSFKEKLNHVPKKRKLAIFQHTGAVLYNAWRKSNPYFLRSVDNIEALVNLVQRIKSVGQENSVLDPLSRVVIGHNDGVISYREFCLLDIKERHTEFFNKLVSTEGEARQKDKGLWNITAAMRRINLKPESEQRGYTLLGRDYYRAVIDGSNITLGDKIIFHGELDELRDQLLDKGRVTLVGNPHIDREQLKVALSGGKPFVDINWVVASETQVLIPKR